jgi:hypothetical protein
MSDWYRYSVQRRGQLSEQVIAASGFTMMLAASIIAVATKDVALYRQRGKGQVLLPFPQQGVPLVPSRQYYL